MYSWLEQCLCPCSEGSTFLLECHLVYSTLRSYTGHSWALPAAWATLSYCGVCLSICAVWLNAEGVGTIWLSDSVTHTWQHLPDSVLIIPVGHSGSTHSTGLHMLTWLRRETNYNIYMHCAHLYIRNHDMCIHVHAMHLPHDLFISYCTCTFTCETSTSHSSE